MTSPVGVGNGAFADAGDGGGFGAFGDPTASALSSALNAAPSLVNQPSTAMAAAGSADPAQYAQVLSQTQNADAISQAQQNAPAQGHKGWLGDITGAIGKVAKDTGVSTLLNYANKPLAEVQRDYRFIHDVYVQHGVFAGLAASLGTVAGGVGGAFVGGPEGAILGADLGSMASRQLFGNTVDSDSNQLSAHQHVSPGRDLANLLGFHNTNKGVGELLSGVTDATFDFAADPLIQAGKLSSLHRSADGLAAQVSPLVQDTAVGRFIAKQSPGLAIRSPQDIDNAYAAYKGVRNFVNEAVNSTPAQLITRHPTLGADAATALGMASTPDQVIDLLKTASVHGTQAFGLVGAKANAAALFTNQFGHALDSVQDIDDVFRTNPQGVTDALGPLVGKTPAEIATANPDLAPLAGELSKAADLNGQQDVLRTAAHSAEMMKRINDGVLPSRSTLRIGASKMAEAVTGVGEDSTNPVGGFVARRLNSFTGYLPTNVSAEGIGTHAFDPQSADAAKTVFQVGRMGLGPVAARNWTNQFMLAGDNLALKKSIYTQMQVEAMKARGIPDSNEYMQDLARTVDQLNNGNALTEAGGHYTSGLVNGDDVNQNMVLDTQGMPVRTENAAVYGYQTGKWTIPKYQDWISAKRNLTTYGQMYDKFDGRVTPIIQGAFKPLALDNAGFGLRISLAELIPQYARNGFLRTSARQSASAAARLAYRTSDVTEGAAGVEKIAPLTPESAHGIAKAAMAAVGKQLAPNEESHIWQAAASAMGGWTGLLRATPEDREIAVRSVVEGDGQVVSGAGRTGHAAGNSSAVPTERISDQIQATLARNKPFKLLDPTDEQYAGFWAKGLSQMAAQPSTREMAQDLLNHESRNPGALAQIKGTGIIPPEVVDREAARIRGDQNYPDGTPILDTLKASYADEARKIQRFRTQDAASFAHNRVDGILGQTVGQDGTVHHDLIQDIANNIQHDVGDLDHIPTLSQPTYIVGRDANPVMPTNMFNKVMEWGFTHSVDPIVNNLSRNPLFVAEVGKQYKILAKGDGNAVDQGLLSDDQAFQIAKERAASNIIPQIHNTALKSQFSIAVKNFMPFYFAQEQAWRRIAVATAAAPQLIRYYQLVNQGLHNPAFIHTDDMGNRSVVLPGVGQLGQGVEKVMSHLGIPMATGLPITYTGDISSLNTVMPNTALPATSPLVSFGSDVVQHFLPEADPALRTVQGSRGFGQPILNQVLPNVFLREEYRAIAGNASDSEMNSAMASAMSAAAAHGELPPEDDAAAQQKFIDKIKNDARSQLMLKGIVSLFSPLSNRPVLEDFGLRDEFYSLVKKDGYAGALVEFQKNHSNLNSSVYTIARSKSPSGAAVPATQQAIDFVGSHTALLQKYSLAAPFLVPQTGKKGDAEVLNQEMITQGLRQTDTPQDLLSSFYTHAGDQQYFTTHKQYLMQLAQITNNTQAQAALQADVGDNTAGVNSSQLESDAKKTQAGAAVVTQWGNWNSLFATTHPLWHDNFTSTTRADRAVNTVKQFYQMAQTGDLPDSPQTAPVTGLASQYFSFLSGLQSAQGNTKAATDARKQMVGLWGETLSNAVAQDPTLTNVVEQVFNRLPTTATAGRQFTNLGQGQTV